MRLSHTTVPPGPIWPPPLTVPETVLWGALGDAPRRWRNPCARLVRLTGFSGGRAGSLGSGGASTPCVAPPPCAARARASLRNGVTAFSICGSSPPMRSSVSHFSTATA